MTHRACGIVNIIIGYQNLLGQIVNIFKGSKFPCVCFVIRYAVGGLNEIFFIIMRGQKINFFSVMIIYLNIVSHIDQFKINNVFQIVCKVKTVVRAAE